jgi:hypothetical protein
VQATLTEAAAEGAPQRAEAQAQAQAQAEAQAQCKTQKDDTQKAGTSSSETGELPTDIDIGF